MCDAIDKPFCLLTLDEVRAANWLYSSVSIDDWAAQCTGEYDYSVPTLVAPRTGRVLAAEKIGERLDAIAPLMELTRAGRAWRLFLIAPQLLCQHTLSSEVFIFKIVCESPLNTTLADVDAVVCALLKPRMRFCKARGIAYLIEQLTIKIDAEVFNSIADALRSSHFPFTEAALALEADPDGVVAPRIWATPAAAYTYAYMTMPLWPEQLDEYFARTIPLAVNGFGVSLALPDAYEPTLEIRDLKISASVAQGNRQMVHKIMSDVHVRSWMGDGPISKKAVDKENVERLRSGKAPDDNEWVSCDHAIKGRIPPLPLSVSDIYRELLRLRAIARDEPISEERLIRRINWRKPALVGISGFYMTPKPGPSPVSGQIAALRAALAAKRALTISKDDDTCTICCEAVGVRNSLTLICGHKFHYYPDDKCSGVLTWFDSGKTSCPNCRGVQPAAAGSPRRDDPSPPELPRQGRSSPDVTHEEFHNMASLLIGGINFGHGVNAADPSNTANDDVDP